MPNPISRVFASFRRIDTSPSSVPYFSLSDSSAVRRTSIDKAGALLSNAYLTAEQAKARALGCLPAKVFTDGSRGREKVPGHPLARLIQRRWNPVMTAQDGWQWTSIRRDTFGTAYGRVQWYQGNPVALWPLDCNVEVVYDPAVTVSPVRYDVAGDRFTARGRYLSHEILAFKTCVSTDGGVTGRSLAELAAAEIGLNVDLTAFYANIIGRGFSPGGTLTTDDELELADVVAIAKKNAALSGPNHSGELRIFDRGLKYTAIGSTMAEADIVKQQEFVLQSVARAVYVQPNKVMDYSRATFSNIEEANISFVVDTITNEVTAIETELHKILETMGQPDNYVKFELRGLLRGDFKSQMAGFKDGVYSGILKRSEPREWMDLPFEEGSDQLLQPAAYFMLDPQTGEPEPLPSSSSASASADPLASVRADARIRIALRAGRDGDTPKTREFAQTALTPVAKAYEALGRTFDIDHEIEESIDATS